MSIMQKLMVVFAWTLITKHVNGSSKYVLVIEYAAVCNEVTLLACKLMLLLVFDSSRLMGKGE